VNQWKEKPFALVGVHVGGSNAPQLKKIMEKEKLTWRSFADAGQAGAGPIAKSWSLSATPTMYVIDHKGVIRRKWTAPPGDVALDAALESLIRAAEVEGQKGAK
jgi:peroxiredoxin